MWWWKQRIHVSWLIAVACAGFVVGVATAPYIGVVAWLGGVGCLASIIACCFKRRWCVPFLMVAAVCTGLGFGAAHVRYRSTYSSLIGKTVTVKGNIKEDPTFQSGGVSLQLTRLFVNDVQMPGTVYATVRAIKDPKRGDSIEGTATVKEGFGSFPASLSFKSVRLFERQAASDLGREVRDWFTAHVRRVIPEPAASLGVGFLTGQKSALTAELSDSLKVAGLTHIIVASGYNLTILVQLARRLFSRLSKYTTLVLAGLMVGGFMAVTGLSPSMTRAGLVTGLSLLAWYYGHSFHPFVLLPFVAAVTVAFDPSYVWGDIGWQLSFSAFAAVMIVGPLLHRYFFGETEPGMFRQLVGETVAAHLVTMPIIALNFGVVSNLAIVANVLVVPLVPLAMLLTFLSGMIVLVFPPLASLVAYPTTGLLNYMLNVAKTVADIPWAQATVGITSWFWAGYGLALVLACIWMWYKTGYTFRNERAFVA